MSDERDRPGRLGDLLDAAGHDETGPGDPAPIEMDRSAPEPPEATGTPAASRGRRILLGSLVAVSLAGTVAIGATGWRVASQKDARLTIPDEVAGLQLDRSENATTTADYLRTGLAAGIRLDESVGAVYADPADAKRDVLLFGGTTLLWRPESDLDLLLKRISDSAGAVQQVDEVPAGELGGVMKCGITATPEGDIPVCGWADHGSVAIAMFPGRDVAESAELLPAIRDAVQQRS